MTALSPANRLIWISRPQSYTGKLYIDRPQTIFAARVNGGLYGLPLVEFAFDSVTVGAYTDVKPNMTFLLGTTAGGDDLGRGRVRLAPTSTIFYPGESSYNDHDGEIAPIDNAYLTAINEYRVWAVHPLYVKTDPPTAYKDYDVTVVTGGRNYNIRRGPKANGGVDRVVDADSVTGLGTFEFSATASLSMTAGATLTTYLWAVGDGTITVGTSASSAITATFPIGRRYVDLTVTDSSGDSHTHHILTIVLSDTHATWKPIMQFEVTEDRDTEMGKVMAFIIRENLPYGTYYDGVSVLYYETERYGSAIGSLAGPPTCEQVKFRGWHQVERESPEASFQGIRKDLEFRCVSTAQRLKDIVLLPQLLKYKESPDAWDETDVHDNQHLAWYLMQWHSTVLGLADFLLPGGFDEPLKKWGTAAGDLWGQLVECAQARAFKFTCDKRGVLRMVGNPQMLEDAERTSTVITSIGVDDATAYEYERKRHPDLYWVDGSAITTGAVKAVIAALFSIAPGDTPGQGAQRSAIGGLIVEDQDQLNDWIGNEYARLNSPWLPLKITLAHSGDAGFDPALMEWITVTLPTTSNRRGRALTTQRCLVTEVNTTHSNDHTRTKVVELTCWIEIPNYAAAERIVQYGEANIPPIIIGNDIYPVIPPTPIGGLAFGASPAVYALPYSGDRIVRTRTQTGSPTWETVFTLASLPSALDFISHFILDSGNPKNAAYVVGVTAPGGAGLAKLFYVEDLDAAPGGQTITLLHSVADTATVAGISSSINLIGAVYGHYTNSGGVNTLFRRSSYAGAFTTTVIGGTPAYDKGIILGHHASGANVGRMCAAGTVDDLYESTTQGSAFSVIRSGPATGRWICAHYPYNNNTNDMILYAGYTTASTPMTIANLQRRNADGSWSSIAPYNAAAAADWRYARLVEATNSFLKIHTYTENRMILAISASHFGLGGFLYTSNDGGDTWNTPISVPEATGGGPSGIGGWPYDPNVLFLFGYNQQPITGGTYGIWWTPDFGVTWNNMLGDWSTSIAAFAGIRNLVPVWVP